MTNDNDADTARGKTGDRVYFQKWAEWHRGRADAATDESTRALHHRFASLYDLRSTSPDGTSSLVFLHESTRNPAS